MRRSSKAKVASGEVPLVLRSTGGSVSLEGLTNSSLSGLLLGASNTEGAKVPEYFNGPF
jgi:hypothetical protein